jgi:hypothetical protein
MLSISKQLQIKQRQVKEHNGCNDVGLQMLALSPFFQPERHVWPPANYCSKLRVSIRTFE